MDANGKTGKALMAIGWGLLLYGAAGSLGFVCPPIGYKPFLLGASACFAILLAMEFWRRPNV